MRAGLRNMSFLRFAKPHIALSAEKCILRLGPRLVLPPLDGESILDSCMYFVLCWAHDWL